MTNKKLDPRSEQRFGVAPTELQHTVRRPAGYTIMVGELDPTVETDTLMCVHCQYHWRVVRGSGRQRGFCANCAGPVCGKYDCMNRCEHWEKKIEIMEGRNPTTSSFAAGWPKVELSKGRIL